MWKTLIKSIREYRKPTILAPVYVTLEVIIECIIPFITALLINQIKAGCTLGVVVRYGADSARARVAVAHVRKAFRQGRRNRGERVCAQPPQGSVLQHTVLFI